MSGSKIAGGPSPNVAGLAVGAVGCAVRQGTLAAAPATVTIIDYSRPSTEPRLWVIDSITGEVLYRELVAHGRNSGDNNASRFSNRPNSLESSLGLFQTADAYVGKNGYSLRLRGLEPGVNDRALERAIVVHGAPYVSEAATASLGRLGRSWGCPAVREPVARPLIDRIKGGSAVFAYYPDPTWLSTSRYLNGCAAPASTN